MEEEDGNDGMRVFVSYSRKDKEFVARLVRAFSSKGILADYDQSQADPNNIATGISAEDEWWLRLQELITVAHLIVFVVSPDSAGSKVCDEEIAFAQGLSKRIICVLRRPIDFAKAPPRLSALNIKISFVDDSRQAFEANLEVLVSSIHRDAKWLRHGSRLTAAASRWAATNQSQDHLLRGMELRQAEDWAARRPKGIPEHSELLLAFLAASREAEAMRTTISSIERNRHLELFGIVRPFLEEEVKVRESLPTPTSRGRYTQQLNELRRLKSILDSKQRWHPEPAVYKGMTSAVDNYAGIFRFPCCNAGVVDTDYDENNPPSQFRDDGCQDVPEPIRYGDGRDFELANYYLIEAYRRLGPPLR
jgi:hypothetical protein